MMSLKEIIVYIGVLSVRITTVSKFIIFECKNLVPSVDSVFDRGFDGCCRCTTSEKEQFRLNNGGTTS